MGEPESAEGHKDRVNRELIEFLNEIRVVLPGVQVLFAFLLTVPFTQRFGQLGPGQRRVYLASVVGAALASVLLIAPAAHHRLRFRSGNKEQMLKVGTVLAIAGIVALAVCISTSVYLVAELIYGGGVAGLIAGLLGGVTALLWFAVPLAYKSNKER